MWSDCIGEEVAAEFRRLLDDRVQAADLVLEGKAAARRRAAIERAQRSRARRKAIDPEGFARQHRERMRGYHAERRAAYRATLPSAEPGRCRCGADLRPGRRSKWCSTRCRKRTLPKRSE